MSNWVDLVLNSTKHSESPERYFYWSALTCIAATVKKNVYLDRFMYKLYPNIYVMLISAKSGLRKGIPISLVNGVLNEVSNTKIITGRNTIESIISQLGSQVTLENGAVLGDAQGILVSDEFANLVQTNPSAMTILTGLHNTHEHINGWRNSLKSSPVEVLKNPCINMIGASNEVLFEEIIHGRDIEGGFIARTFIVHESKRRNVNSLMERPEGLLSKSELACYLKTLTSVKGEFKITSGAKKDYNLWYNKICALDYDDRTGTLERLGDQVLKVGMLLSLAKSTDLIINEETLEEAISRSEECFSGTKKVSMSQGKAETAPAVAKILKLLMGRPDLIMSRKKILQVVWPDIDAVSLDRVVDTLQQSGAIREFYANKQVYYELDKDVYLQYKNFQDGTKS